MLEIEECICIFSVKEALLTKWLTFHIAKDEERAGDVEV